MTVNCDVCGTRLDPVWVEIGETKHPTCVLAAICAHGEVRGPRYCALCRYENPWIQPPEGSPRKRRKLQRV
jgi:hypothetical protein